MPSPLELQTERLRMRALGPEDAPALHRLLNDPDVGRYLCDGEPVPPSMVEAILARSAADFAGPGFGLFALRERSAEASSVLIGLTGFRIPVPGPASPHGSEHPELLFALEPRRWGGGLTTEAGRRALAFAFETLARPRVTAAANPANVASWRVLERLGFARTGRFSTPGEDLYTYELTRPDFLARRLRSEDP